MALVQRINDLELTLEPLSDSIVEVRYQEQVGWFGVNLGEDVDAHPFAWTTDLDSRTQAGLTRAHPATDPGRALEDLSAQLALMQSALNMEKRSDPRQSLGTFLDTLPQSEVKKKAGWRNFVDSGLRGINRSKDVLQDRATKGKDVLQDRATKGKDVLQDRATKGMDVLQDRATKGMEALKEAASPSLACEREGHVFDDVRLVGSSNNLPRFCRRCRNLVNVAQENGGAASIHNQGKQGDR